MLRYQDYNKSTDITEKIKFCLNVSTWYNNRISINITNNNSLKIKHKILGEARSILRTVMHHDSTYKVKVRNWPKFVKASWLRNIHRIKSVPLEPSKNKCGYKQLQFLHSVSFFVINGYRIRQAFLFHFTLFGVPWSAYM